MRPPTLALANDSGLSSFFAHARNSAALVCVMRLGFTIITYGVEAMLASGVKSVSGL